MRRYQLVELHDLAGFPAAWRDPFTDFMAFYAERFRPYARVIPILAEALRRAGTDRLIDLGSGGGAAVLALKPGGIRGGRATFPRSGRLRDRLGQGKGLPALFGPATVG